MEEYLGNNKPVNAKRPLVSVCVQTYNHESYIATCIESILAQRTNFEFELIIGEDESTDATREICKKYASENPDKIRLFLRSNADKISINGKKTGRYNFTENLKAARGSYIALCDGDDYWTDKSKLQRQADFLEKHTDYSICFHKTDKVVEGRQKPDFLNEFTPSTSTAAFLARGNYIRPLACMFRNNLHEHFPQFIYKAAVADYVLHLHNASFGKIKYFDEVMGAYRIHSGGIWSQYADVQRQIEWLQLLEGLMGTYSAEVDQNLQLQHAEICLDIARKHRESGNSEEADKYDKMPLHYGVDVDALKAQLQTKASAVDNKKGIAARLISYFRVK